MATLPARFPLRDTFKAFLRHYSRCSTYWYIPKARVLNDQTVQDCAQILTTLFDELGQKWNREFQDYLLATLIERGILHPTKPDGSPADRTALVRIYKKLFETLGLVWVQDDTELVITDVGFELLSAVDDVPKQRSIIAGQVAKFQYPNPTLAGVGASFTGLLPELFLLQVLQQCDYQISTDEFELFVNLSQEQTDVDLIVRYIRAWRDLSDDERKVLLRLVKRIPMRDEALAQRRMFPLGAPSKPRRYNRIRLNSSYQRSFFCYPTYIEQDGSTLACTSKESVDTLIDDQLGELKVTLFESLDDWLTYFGDPNQKPTWFTYISFHIETSTSETVAHDTVAALDQQPLTQEQKKEIKRLQIEKGIETFYAERIELLEAGLQLEGRQVSTPIGRMDLLCKAADGRYVVVEVKAAEATDAVFGQILRYIGWIHRNYKDGADNVRGIILASQFPDTARYSRLGLLKNDHKQFLGFKRHGLDVDTI